MTIYRARGGRAAFLWIAAILVALIGGGVAGALIATSRTLPSAPNSGRSGSKGSSRTPTSSSVESPPLSITSISPAANANGVAGNSAITISFSSAISQSSPLPTLDPSSVGTWKTNANVVTFTPSGAYTPSSTVTLTVPGGPSGIEAEDGSQLSGNVVERFRVADGSILRLQQLLSLLDYSPLSWTPTSSEIAANDTSAQQIALFTPPQGSFTWIDHGWPGELRRLWKAGSYTVLTKGLVMSFQADHGLDPNGSVGPKLWNSLVDALGANSVNTGGYNYALANKTTPESFTVWHDGRLVVKSPMNTGIAGSPTPDGNFPVFTRLRNQIMRGTNPDGSKYADPVQFVAYFHKSDAVHYMPRGDYGIPQSLGCIELPLPDAARVWPYLAYGTLVSVVG
jgi:hypothetical protein